MLREFWRFAKKRPINGFTLAAVGLYTTRNVLRAFSAPAGQYWPKDIESIESIEGIGATTSTSTSSAIANKRNLYDAMGASMSTTSSTSSSHAHLRNSAYGEDTYKSPLTLMGVPNAVKRRVMVNDIGDEGGYYAADASHLFGHQQQAQMSDSEVLEIAGAGGWM